MLTHHLEAAVIAACDEAGELVGILRPHASGTWRLRPNFRGVLLARINADISLADFEAGVRNLVSDTEQSYWELYFAYRNLEARKAGRDSADVRRRADNFVAAWRTLQRPSAA